MAKRGRPRKIRQIEVRGIVANAQSATHITERQLYDLYIAFHRRLRIFKTREDDLVIFSYDDQLNTRLLALLPLMPHFREQKLLVPQQQWCELKLEEALGNALR